MSTILYTVMGVHLTVSIWPSAIPYLSHPHLFESPHRYGNHYSRIQVKMGGMGQYSVEKSYLVMVVTRQ
jgi:hypothetical protein